MVGLVCGGCRHLSPRDEGECSNCGLAIELGVDPTEDRSTSSPTGTPSPSQRRLNPLEQSGGFLDGVQMSELADEPVPEAAGVMAVPGDDDEAPALAPEWLSAQPDELASEVPIGEPTTTPPPGSRVCGECGAGVASDYKFCGRCGGLVAGAGPAAEPEGRGVTIPAEHPDGSGPEPSTAARLVVVHGEGVDGMAFGVKGAEAVAGRTTGQILFPDDGYVSPVHARFYYRDDELFVRDEDSANGVYSRIDRTAELENGDLILVGEQLLRVEATRPPADGPDGEGTFFLGCRVTGGQFRLVQLFPGPREGRVYVCQNDAVTIGREGCDLNFPNDRFMSRRHAQVHSSNGVLKLSDLGSRNGTFVRIKEDTHIRHGDHLFIGQQLLRVEF